MMPEPLLGETVTDIDRDEAGEIEVDTVGSAFRSTRAEWFGQAGLEVEWRALERLGLSLEGGLSADDGVGGGARAAGSWLLFHDFARDFHLQLEASSRLYESSTILRSADPSEPALPFAAGVRWAVRDGRVTIRGGLGVSAGAASAHPVPLRASLAALYQLGQGASFAGAELLADWGYAHPFTVAPEVLLDAAPLHLPCRVGVAVPWLVGGRGGGPAAIGVNLRVIFEAAQ